MGRGIRILHVVGGMNAGGVETWLMQVMRDVDRRAFRMDFVAGTDCRCTYDDEIAGLGGRVYQCPAINRPLRFAAQLAQVLVERGPFDVVHSHLCWRSGHVLRLAAAAGVPVRIAHSHDAVAGAPGWNLPRRAYQRLMRSWILRHSTDRLAGSQAAGETLFGRKPAAAFRVFYYGSDFKPFATTASPDEAKRRLGIPPERKVIGHIGPFDPVHNHAFLVDVFHHVERAGFDVHLVLAGTGDLFPAVRKEIERRGLAERCTLAGLRRDVPALMHAMDFFVLPSLREGVSTVALEAQAAGVPVIASTGVPPEAVVIPRLVERMRLSAGADAWGSFIAQRLLEPSPRRGDEAAVMQASAFALPACIAALCGIYSAAAGGSRELAPAAEVARAS